MDDPITAVASCRRTNLLEKDPLLYIFNEMYKSHHFEYEFETEDKEKEEEDEEKEKEEYMAAESVVFLDTPLASPYNNRIRPLLDAIDELRYFKLMPEEGIDINHTLPIPTIVVIGDRSSGKSSVLESLAGINLPRLCTRVPLLLRLQSSDYSTPKISLHYNGKVVSANEKTLADKIIVATEKIAGKGQGVCATPVTVNLKKQGLPYLTMVDLPGIIPVPEDVYHQVSNIIMDYISPKETIILNVLSAASSVHFSTCESIRMSKQVDNTGTRTLAVVTKADRSPEGLLDKVRNNDVEVGLGCICVINRIGHESYEQARCKEALLFETHEHLSQIDKSIVGIPALAKKLVNIQETIMKKYLPDIVLKIEEKIKTNLDDLMKVPNPMDAVIKASTAVGSIVDHSSTFRKLVDEYSKELQHHADRSSTFRKLVDEYSKELQHHGDIGKDFLVDEINKLKDARTFGPSNFLSRQVFMSLVEEKVKTISEVPSKFIEKYWNYVESVCLSVLMSDFRDHPQILSSIKREVQNLVEKTKQHSFGWVNNIVEMEKHSNYTTYPEYMETLKKLMAYQDEFMKILTDDSREKWNVQIDGLGEIDIGHLRGLEGYVLEAFDMKMRLIAYWEIIVKRLIDYTVNHCLHYTNQSITSSREGWQRMLESSVAKHKERLETSMEVLERSKNVVNDLIEKFGK
ncbi:hypothetical protein ACJIZ3_004855 [Penstemon smallii]|uniref:Dynamin-type G domain-containing protein n=1 Tax=Penstemon smallii TaxID=265156 RepID=A0ABD3S3F3_9LAMI